MDETANKNNKVITGERYAQMLYGGATLLSKHMDEVNDLNVFPVPDGDTGTNMSRTMEGGLSEISTDGSMNVGELSSKFAHGVLLGARGNSGVILSQIFAGIGEELKQYDTVSAKELAIAYKNGIKKAYASVKNPTEGTILTVFRESSEYAAENIDDSSSVEDFLKLHIDAAKRSLAHTKEILPILAEADVVDSGGAGYLYIALGMYEALIGELDPDYKSISSPEAAPKLNIDLFTRDSKLEYGYCTEFLLRLMTEKVDPDNFDITAIHDAIAEIGGDSVVAYQTEDIVKVHVHTFRPGDMLSKMQQFGEFLTVKIENMSVGHTENEPKKKTPPKKYAALAVAAGDGMKALFTHLGADGIIDGGQTSNPSTEDFIRAFDKCDAENIIVLPNNKNVILAANQAAELYDKAKVHIVKTRTPMQCYSALSVLTPGLDDVNYVLDSLNRAAGAVVGSEITRAVRDVTLNGREIKKGNYISITDGEISAVEKSAEDAVMAMLGDMDTDDYEILALFVGKTVSPEARDGLCERIEEEYPDLVVELYESGLESYDYLVAIE